MKYQFLNELLSSDFFNLFFLVFCLAILLNGSNFLDGLNGLVSGYYIFILLSLLFLNNSFSEQNLLAVEKDFLILFLFILIIFFVFNIFGLVYLGVRGTYAIALLMGKTESFKKLNIISDDFKFCVELPIKMEISKMKYTSIPSFEKKRIAGVKKVSAIIDGSLILIEIIKLFFLHKILRKKVIKKYI